MVHNDLFSLLFQRSPSELSGYQKKVFPIDDHVGMAMSGLTADSRALWYHLYMYTCKYILYSILFMNSSVKSINMLYLSRFMRAECLGQKWAYSEPLPVNRLVSALASSVYNFVIAITNH